MKVCFSNEKLDLSSNSIFLAGPTTKQGYSDSWRVDAVRIAEELGFDGTLYIPEYTGEQVFKEEDLFKQTVWEWKCLDVAGIVLFWVPRSEKLPGMTTNVEFGIYTERKPRSVVLGYPETANGMKYMRLRYLDTVGEEPKNTLEDTMKRAIEKLEWSRKNNNSLMKYITQEDIAKATSIMNESNEGRYSKLDTSGILGFGDKNRVVTIKTSEVIPWVRNRIHKAIKVAYDKGIKVYLVSDQQELKFDIPKISKENARELLNNQDDVMVIAVDKEDLDFKDIIKERDKNYLLHIQPEERKIIEV